MDDREPARRAWKPIEPLDPASLATNGSLAALDALRAEWERLLSTLPEAERSKIRQRSLRRLAIETGIIERLYEIEWGLTLTLAAEGFTREVVERADGRIDDHTLATLQAQRDSLEMVLDFVRQDRELSPSFIKELHAATTRTQATYTATDALGRTFGTELAHGEWKKHANHVLRSDGTLLEYAPPEQVASEIDRLVDLHRQLQGQVHPIIESAWLHHRFVQIHPFADGNGRVARALTLLVLLKHRYAPLVVDRFHRGDYLSALDEANEGHLHPLIRLFSRLEVNALAGELERAEEPAAKGVALDVAHTLAAQLSAHRGRRQTEIEKTLAVRGKAVSARMGHWFGRKRDELEAIFEEQGLGSQILMQAEASPSERTRWFRHQVVESAHVAGHYADFGGFVAWAQIRIRVEGIQLRYVASLHGAGRDAGVLAVTTFAEWVPLQSSDDGQAAPTPHFVHTTKDAFVVLHSESLGALDERAGELEELLDEGLAVALTELQRQLRP
jgi:Fic family protein